MAVAEPPPPYPDTPCCHRGKTAARKQTGLWRDGAPGCKTPDPSEQMTQVYLGTTGLIDGGGSDMEVPETACVYTGDTKRVVYPVVSLKR